MDIHMDVSWSELYPQVIIFDGHVKKKNVQLMRFLLKSLDSLSELRIAYEHLHLHELFIGKLDVRICDRMKDLHESFIFMLLYYEYVTNWALNSRWFPSKTGQHQPFPLDWGDPSFWDITTCKDFYVYQRRPISCKHLTDTYRTYCWWKKSCTSWYSR